MFNIMAVVFPIIFLLVLGFILFVMIRGILMWNKNNNSPVIIVPAVVVTKRSSTTHHTSDGARLSSSSTNYFVTFQLESDDRIEFSVSGTQYGQIAEQDNGKLNFQEPDLTALNDSDKLHNQIKEVL